MKQARTGDSGVSVATRTKTEQEPNKDRRKTRAGSTRTCQKRRPYMRECGMAGYSPLITGHKAIKDLRSRNRS